ncbi:MAG: autotransporter-associated beta strand repeat-containing protein [Kiritimatiellia bacterium]
MNQHAQVTVAGNDTRVGNLAGSSGTLTLNDGSQFNMTGNNLMVGDSASAAGTVNINGSAVVNVKTLMTWSGAGTVNINGGSLNTAGTLATGWITLGQNAGATAVWNHNAGTVATPTVWTTYNAAGTYNLNGGILATSGFSKGSGAGVFNFNGGTLKASGAFTLGGGNVTTAQVRNGGAVIDSNGQSATISQGLIHSGIGGDNATDGGLTKTGAGSLTLSGSNSYTGTTTVSQGTLLLNGSTASAGLINVSALATLGGSGSGGNVTVADNGILSPGSVTSNQFSMQDLTLGNAAVLAFELDAPDPSVNVQNDYLNITGNLLLDGVLQVTKRTVPGFGTPVLGDKWLLMSVGGAITDQGLAVDPSAPALSSGLAYAVETDTSVPGFGKVYLAVVPEPGTAGLVIFAGLLLLRRRVSA